MGRKRVYIAHTGGTIGMKKGPRGYHTEPGYLAERMKRIPELASDELPEYTIREYDRLLDSSNMKPADWLKIARDIADHYEEYDGFVILHGTDTMAYTASALPFMLEGLAKPVILTGAQIPLAEVRSDGRDNLIAALILAGRYPIPEVGLYFNHKLLRGCRAKKVNAYGFDAFASPNYPALGSVGLGIDIHHDRLLKPPPPGTRLAVHALSDSTVGALRLFPGIRAEILANALKPPLKGLVLEAYGLGNAPQDPDFLATLEEATARGVVIVDCTQCLRGTVDLTTYATGSALARVGVISGYDMTAEAALAKLFYLFTAGHPPAEVQRLTQRDLRGELTPPEGAGTARPS